MANINQKLNVLFYVMFTVFCNAYCIDITWNGSWKRSNLDTFSITSLLYTNDRQRICVGTDNGLFVGKDSFSTWMQIPIPVLGKLRSITHIIEKPEDKSIVFLYHNDSDTTYLFSGKYLDKPPWYLCTKLISKNGLQQIASSIYDRDTLYASDGRQVFKTFKSKQGLYDTFTLIPGPLNLFGQNKWLPYLKKAAHLLRIS